MFGIGSGELLLIIVVAVLVLGPEHLPRIMRTTQTVMSTFRKITTEFQRTLNLEDVLKDTDSRPTTKRQPSTTKKKKKRTVDSTTATKKKTAKKSSAETSKTKESTQKTSVPQSSPQEKTSPEASTASSKRLHDSPAQGLDAHLAVDATAESGKSDKFEKSGESGEPGKSGESGQPSKSNGPGVSTSPNLTNQNLTDQNFTDQNFTGANSAGPLSNGPNSSNPNSTDPNSSDPNPTDTSAPTVMATAPHKAETQTNATGTPPSSKEETTYPRPTEYISVTPATQLGYGTDEPDGETDGKAADRPDAPVISDTPTDLPDTITAPTEAVAPVDFVSDQNAAKGSPREGAENTASNSPSTAAKSQSTAQGEDIV